MLCVLLLSAENSKFQRGRGSNTSRTDSALHKSHSLENNLLENYSKTTCNCYLLPLAISPLGLFGPTIILPIRHTTKGNYKTLHNIDSSKFPNANASNMARQAFTKTKNTFEHSSTSRFYLEIKATKLPLWLWRIIEAPTLAPTY